MAFELTFSKIKTLNYRLLLRRIILLLLSARLFMHLLYSPENWTQIPKDLEYAKAFILLFVIVAVYRGIKLTDWKVWVYAGLSIGAGFICFKVKGYAPEAYGELLFEYMEVRAVMQFIFIGLMLDLLRHRPYRWDVYLKNPAVILYVLFSIIFIITDYKMIVPLICPMAAVFLTRFDKSAKKEFVFVLAGGLYLAFVKCFTQSLMQQPDHYSGRHRYIGVFLSPTTIGYSVGCALIVGVFFVLYFIKTKNKIGAMVSFILTLYPLTATVMCGARCVYLGIVTGALGLFIFAYSKNKKSMLKRLGISVGIIVLSVPAVFALSWFLNFLRSKGCITTNGLTNSLARICLMTGGGQDEASVYASGTFMYGLDVLTNGRLELWHDALKQIRLWGHPYGVDLTGNTIGSDMIPHNLYLSVLVRYGILGGVFFILWWVLSLVKARKGLQTEFTSMLWVILWLSFLAGVYLVHYEMFENIGGTVLLLSLTFLISPYEIDDKKIIILK